MPQRKPVADWTSDFDHLDPAWSEDPFSIWNGLREACPFARTSRFDGAVLPTRYRDIKAIAFDAEHFSSRQIILRDAPLTVDATSPPMTSDPPHHRDARHLLAPLFRGEAIAAVEPLVQACCMEALAPLAGQPHCDAAIGFSRIVPARVLMAFLGLPDKDLPRLRPWVDFLLDEGVEDTAQASEALVALSAYMARQLARQRARPGTGALGHLLRFRKDGHPLGDRFIVDTMRLLLAAGMDTTAGALGAALWHLARFEADRRTIVAHPERLDIAVDEMLRLYAPVTMAREVVATTEIGGVRFDKGEKVLLCYPAANRDPDAFPEPDRFDLDRDSNRHFAFGTGIHRCLGADLARLILRVALRSWLNAFPEFRLDPTAATVWSRGSVRGPKALPLVLA